MVNLSGNHHSVSMVVCRTSSSSSSSSCIISRRNIETELLELKEEDDGCKRGIVRVSMRGDTSSSSSRKQLQRGRNLSIEAILTVQALKRAKKHNSSSLEHAFDSKFKRLLKSDSMAVLRELLRQNECFLALQVFEDVRKEYWYKPEVSLYADMITVLVSNDLYEQVEILYRYLKVECNLEPDSEGFNALLRTLVNSNIPGLAIDCFYLMKASGCEPDKSSLRILANGLESKGETKLSAFLREEAQKYYGESLEFLNEEQEDMSASYK